MISLPSASWKRSSMVCRVNKRHTLCALLLISRTWPTSRMGRPRRLSVIGEVQNGLSYYRLTFLRQLPRRHAEMEDVLVAQSEAWKQCEVPSIMRMGSWIGGDRDGDPYVTAEVLRDAVRLHALCAIAFYLEELHQLGGELSLASLLAKVSDSLSALATRSPDHSPHRAD